MTVKDYGIVFDIDGVLYRGGSLIHGAKETIEKVTTLGIPHLFFTNNGMETEAVRAERLSKQMGRYLPPEKFVLCHSALKSEAAAMGDGLVLVTGYCHMDSVELMKVIGFKNVHTIDAYAACHPQLYPLKAYPTVQEREWADESVEMIVLLETSMQWSQDIQIICDLMMHCGYSSPSAARGHSSEMKQPRIIGCNFDFTYMAGHECVRFGPGAFVDALSMLYTKLSGGDELQLVRHGKPHRPMYTVAEQRLRNQLPSPSSHDLRRIYAIGDNPHSDVRGANNAGDHWTSVLVRTGCFQGGENDVDDPADYVADDVAAAVEWILRQERSS